jgi:cytochrome oxidase Cu insertion factor (SCO1/SenC/PrrC family)
MRNTLLLTTGLLLPALATAQATNYPNGSTVDNFTVTDVDGNSHDLYAYHAAGKYVLLDFFFYNCGPCQANAPALGEFYQTYGCNSADVIVLSVNWGEDTDAQVAAFGEDFGGSFAHPPAIGSGGSNEVDAAFGISAYPTFTLIGPDHVMINNDIWPLSNGAQTIADAFPAGAIAVADCAVGVPERFTTTSLQVSPVPSTGELNVDLGLAAGDQLTLQVNDLLGRTVHQTVLGRMAAGLQRRTLDLADLSEGQYILNVLDDRGTVNTARFVIAH